MKHSLFASAALLLCGATASLAQDKAVAADESSASPSRELSVSYELETDASYVGDASTGLGRGRTGQVSEELTSARLIAEPRWGEGPIYRFGLGFQRYSFGLPSAAPLPNTLQGFSAIVGIDFQLGESWLVRVEAEPGFYTASAQFFRGKDFNVPFLIGGSYIAGANLQWILGVSVDLNRRWPVIPAVGVRWNFMDRWTLNAVLPTPRLEFSYNKNLTLFVGADLKGGTFRTDGDFGDAHDLSRLNDAWVEYEEIRVGGGLAWKAFGACTVEIEGGYLPYREFNFHRADRRFESDGGAAYGQMAVSAKF